MRKVIIAFDGKHFSEGAFEFLRRLNEKNQVLAVGVFLPAIDYAELLYSLGGLSGPIYYKEAELEDPGIVERNIERFKALCIRNGIEFRVHPDFEKHVISEVVTESRYADLLILSSELFYENLGADGKEDYIQNVLHKAECPIVLVPEHYLVPDNVILAFDGSAASVYAIKQFAYLLPEFADLKTLLVFANAKSEDIPGLSYVEELAARHFKDLSIYKLEFDPKKYFNTWLDDNGNSFLVTGAYGRNLLSEMLSKSFITETMQDHRLPIFIAHR
jgi:nucleotide-binding universal stress UspA family protein